MKSSDDQHENCGNTQVHLAIRDTMELLSGKWKIRILGSLLHNDSLRFMDVLRTVDGIAAKMLSKELQDLEAHQLVQRTVLQTKPITVEYRITPYGQSLKPVIMAIAEWGVEHRKRIFEKTDLPKVA